MHKIIAFAKLSGNPYYAYLHLKGEVTIIFIIHCEYLHNSMDL